MNNEEIKKILLKLPKNKKKKSSKTIWKIN